MLLRKRVTFVLFYKGKLLVARHIGNLRYSLLGGGIKRGENLEESVRREIKEEMGDKTRITSLKYLFSLDMGIQRHFVFFIKLRGKIENNWEIRKLKRINVKNHSKYKLNRFSCEILKKFAREKGF